MRAILIAAAVAGAASLLPVTEAKAQYAAFCAEYSRGGGTNCGFYTYAQCLATISGIGGWCYANPKAGYYDGSGPDDRRYVRKKKRRSAY
jgi:hypothetical protein